jgi:hypothetical protein
MASNVYPAPSAGGGIKTVQRGSTAVAGAITITAVDMTKTTVNSFSTASTGVIALSGTTSGSTTRGSEGATQAISYRADQSSNIVANISAGGDTNTLVSKVAGAYLSSSTQITTTGACRYEVVEFA